MSTTVNITLASKTASNLFLPFFLLDHFWLKVIPCSLEAVLGTKKAFMDFKSSGLPNLKILDSLKFSLLATCDLIRSEMLWASSQMIKGRLRAMVEAMADFIEKK